LLAEILHYIYSKGKNSIDYLYWSAIPPISTQWTTTSHIKSSYKVINVPVYKVINVPVYKVINVPVYKVINVPVCIFIYDSYQSLIYAI